MSKFANYHFYLFLTLMGASLLAGCAATSEFMKPDTIPMPPKPQSGQARIIFVRPSSFAFAIKFTILNHQGQFVGDSLPRSQFGINVPPGKHIFIVWAENTAALQADVVADRTYFVEVAPKMGAFSARCHLMAITPRHDNWVKLGEWLNNTDRLTPNHIAGQAYVTSRKDDAMERIRRGMEHLSNYTPEERNERTIYPTDGR